MLKQRNKAASDSKLLSAQAEDKSAGDYKAGWEMLELGSAQGAMTTIGAGGQHSPRNAESLTSHLRAEDEEELG